MRLSRMSIEPLSIWSLFDLIIYRLASFIFFFVGLVRNGNSASSSVGGNTVVDIDDEKVDITEELEELFRRDQAAVKEDIRKFISERHISQSAIAKATKNGNFLWT